MTTGRQIMGGIKAAAQPSTHGPTRIVSITSGKGGVGKTLTTVNLAVAARLMGRSVLIFDGDLGLANVDVVLGLQPRYNIKDVLDGQVSLKQIIVDGPLGIRVVPSGSGISRLAHLTYVQRLQLLEQIEQLDERPDLMLIDTGAGISENVLHLNSAADTIVVVTTPEPHALTDAYAVIKVLSQEQAQKRFKLLVNTARSADEGHKVASRLCDVATRFLPGIRIDYLGSVPFDPQVQRSVMMRQAASERSTHTIAGQAWNDIARQILGSKAVERKDVQRFWQQVLVQPVNASSLRVEA